MLNVAEIVRPKNLVEVFDYLESGEWILSAGGTDVLPKVRDGLYNNARILDLQYIKKNFSAIYTSESGLHIGALTTLDVIVKSDVVRAYFPVLREALRLIGSAQIRKRATLGGNIINASPAADSVPAILAAEGMAVIQSREGKRLLALEELLQGPGKTSIGKSEILSEIIIPLGKEPWKGAYYKVGGRNALAISIADVAVLYHPEYGFRIACGSVGPKVLRMREVERIFCTEGMTKDMLKAAVEKEIHPIDDIRASAGYRMSVVINLLWNAYFQCKEGSNEGV